MATLTGIRVDDLLGRFDHDVPFPAEDSFIILHGPNGVGKTHFLQLIQYALSGEFWNLDSIRFSRMTLDFSDGFQLNVKKSKESTMERIPPKIRNPQREPRVIEKTVTEVQLLKFGKEISTWRSDTSRRDGRMRLHANRIFEMELGLERSGPDEWFDPRSERFLSADEALSVYSRELPPRVRETLSSTYQITDEISDFLSATPVKFVQTQRLLASHEVRRRPSERRTPPRPRHSTVGEFSKDITRIIADKLAENSKISSRLDRTFPMRVLTGDNNPNISTEQLLAKHEQQIELRNRLAEVSLADTSIAEYPAELLLNDRILNPTETRVLDTYLQDAEQKLGTFKESLDKITLFRNIINDRFLYKTLKIDAAEGFIFETDENEKVSPDQLSSGEQHELVLLYELLFRTDPGSVVLIDEPEISLHVKWQRAFIDDLRAVSELSNLRFIIATHSPQIVDKWHSKAVFLAPGEDW